MRKELRDGNALVRLHVDTGIVTQFQLVAMESLGWQSHGRFVIKGIGRRQKSGK